MKLKTIDRIYKELNAEIFADILERPVLRFTRNPCHAQYINSRRSVIEFNPRDIKGLYHARSIVYHEMIHQYIEEILELDEENHHGGIFWHYYRKHAPDNVELGECL